MPYYQVCVQVPQKVILRLEEIEQKYGVRKEDILLRALNKVIYEEFK